MLLECLESPDFYSRLYSLQLLSNLLKARPTLIQNCLLSSALGISRLVASLNDNREAVRNGTHPFLLEKLILETLLVLIALTEGNPEIQKLVAFENAFETLFVVIEQEGGVDGGIVVQDCLQLLTNLLRYNSSNQVSQSNQHLLMVELLSRDKRGSTPCWSHSLR
jgi:intracellular protein transport protein USO1